MEVIEFLAGNRLALRGDWHEEERDEGGLFNSLFEMMLLKDPKLVESQKFMPPGITYKSPEIQNQIIDILAKELRQSIIDEIRKADVNWFTILFDGTKDKNRNECISIAARFISNGTPLEVLLFFETSANLDAGAFTELLLESLQTYGLDAKNIISQCYDGAAVMNGYKTGVAQRLQENLKKPIPYVHCFNHRLHLIVIDTIKQISSAKEFFDQLQLIYVVFNKPEIRKLYEGKAVKSLLDTRWNGHKQASKAILENYTEIIATLQQVENDRKLGIDGDVIATCIGILKVITQKCFVFFLVFINEFLSVISPADTAFQKREIGYHRAVPILEAVKSSIEEFRESKKFDKTMEDAENLIAKISLPARPARRTRRISSRLDNFSIEETIGQRSDEDVEIQSCYFRIIDVSLDEFNKRFTENNDILQAISNSSEMLLADLKPLEKVGLKMPDEYELKTAEKYVDGKRTEWEKERQIRKEKEKSATTSKKKMEEPEPQFNMLATLYEYREVFPAVYQLYAAIETFACSTAVCESSFSTLARVDIPSRLSMTNKRMRNLAFLAFEQKRLKNILVENILRKFNDEKQRKVQLF